MSRKTKAELEAKICELEGRLEERDNTIKILRDHHEMMHACVVEDSMELKITEEAHDTDIQKLAKLGKGRVQRGWEALARKKYLQSQYAAYREEGFNIGQSRDKANGDMAEEFKRKPLEKRQLQVLLKD